MTSFSAVSLVFLVLTALAFMTWAGFSILLHKAKPQDLAWRGIVKMVTLNALPAPLTQIYSRWFAALIVFFVLGSICVACIVWATDHSFLVVLFPLLFYYFFLRFFFWEKADLND